MFDGKQQNIYRTSFNYWVIIGCKINNSKWLRQN